MSRTEQTIPTEAPAAPAVDTSYRDVTLSIEERVDVLLGQMTLAEKAGQLFHPMIRMGERGSVAGADEEYGILDTVEMIRSGSISHFNLFGPAENARDIAEWNNRLQELARSTRLGIPVTLSTDPRHSFTNNPGTGAPAGSFSQWPEPMGLAATRSEDLVAEFADIARQEYRAVGFRVALHPQIDLATEPRWARQVGTFGEDPDLTARLGAAYIRGFQGDRLGPDGVSTIVKHFPGGGPQADGEDPHFSYGRDQVYPGGAFDLHLRPFRAAVEAGAGQMMPYYGIPRGTDYEEVAFGFNRGVITDLLRGELGFDGIVCTDWGIITDRRLAGQLFPARAWGVEHLAPLERMAMAVDAGADQFGGEDRPDMLVELVTSGRVTEGRIDDSVRRLLREKFRLGLFDDPFVDVDLAESVVGQPRFRAAGRAAQRRAITRLTDDDVVPAGPGLRLFVQGVDTAAAAEYGTVVEDPAAADLAVIRLQAPFRDAENGFEAAFHAGSLEFPEDTVADVLRIAGSVPTVLDVFMDRPAILTPFVDVAAAILVDYGADDRAVLDVVFGRARAEGRLPTDLPSSMGAVEAARPDVPFDTVDPLFRFGDGIVDDHIAPGAEVER
jgi:beta-glucosidase